MLLAALVPAFFLLLLFFLALLHIRQHLASAALLEFLSGTAWTRIVRINLSGFSLLRSLRRRILIGSRHLGCRLSLHLLLYADVVKGSHCILADGGRHGVEHLVAAHLVLNQRILLAVCLEADSLPELIHVVDMSHPLVVNYLQKNHALQLTDLLCLRELSFLRLVELGRGLLQHML